MLYSHALQFVDYFSVQALLLCNGFLKQVNFILIPVDISLLSHEVLLQDFYLGLSALFVHFGLVLDRTQLVLQIRAMVLGSGQPAAQVLVLRVGLVQVRLEELDLRQGSIVLDQQARHLGLFFVQLGRLLCHISLQRQQMRL